ncbi:hypothetical protein G647_08246 [Cladophialophora carrionii CBS 160.54]|uniref:Zn(2)-C6 fungal-type domain-containing protein n=1 Tax=Cladophialophora carrionii CBS 160.54 TaxID=1279043 RepID=V9D2J5_9EURO|nr:uncharacterized protein G647_08246 [Cladophialophora carrionii CBS 160.54]ETI20212.1 hypothetical protein G647_08246 [Cladophialophora carrionii CBS 160.54]
MSPSPEVLDKATSHATSGSTSPPTTDNKKLRLSCDNCHAAKVKCTKERPLCTRCANSGTPCIYSKSRRAGKPKGCGKKAGSFSKVNSNSNNNGTPSLPTAAAAAAADFSSHPDSPLSDARMSMSMDFDDAWSVDLSGSRRGSTLDPTFTTLQAMAAAAAADTSTSTSFSLDPTLTQTFTHSTIDTDDFSASGFSTNMLSASVSASTSNSNSNSNSADFKLSPGTEWMCGLDSGGTHLPFTTAGPPTDSLSCGPTAMLYSDFSSDTSTLNDDCSMSAASLSVSGSAATSTSTTSQSCTCTCTGSLQDILSALNATMPSFDKFLAINKTAVQRMAHTLACHCLPDISSVMLLSVIITRIVQTYQKIRNGEHPQGCEAVGVTLGSMKMDSEDEYQIKMVLIRSELRKIKALVTRFRDRFENSLQGPDRQLYEANMAFLEYGLEDTIRGL